MTVYLIRHGMTEANEKHLYCGSTDLPLSDAGRDALSDLRYAVSCGKFLTSGMRRTEETLQRLFGEVPHEMDARFREVDFGDFEMKSYEELKDDAAYQAWISGENEKNVPPHGESGDAMTRRVISAFRDVLSSGEDTVIVTHGGVIAAIMQSLFPEAGKHRYAWQPKPGHGYKVTESGYEAIP